MRPRTLIITQLVRLDIKYKLNMYWNPLDKETMFSSLANSTKITPLKIPSPSVSATTGSSESREDTAPLKAVVHRYYTEFVPIDTVSCMTPRLRSATPVAILSPVSSI